MKNSIAKFALSFAFAFIGMTSTMLFANNTMPANDTTIAMASELPGVKTIEAVTLAESQVCESILAHAPVGRATTFSKDLGKVWVYSKFTMDKSLNSTIQHVYYFNEKKISAVSLDVRGPSFRTSSYKTITKNMVGDWKVEITADNGEIFETLEFTITE